jgi:cell division protein FtsN
MNSQSIAGVLGAIVAAVVMVVAIAYGPIGQFRKPARPASAQQPATGGQPVPTAPAPRGPVIREVPN